MPGRFVSVNLATTRRLVVPGSYSKESNHRQMRRRPDKRDQGPVYKNGQKVLPQSRGGGRDFKKKENFWWGGFQRKKCRYQKRVDVGSPFLHWADRTRLKIQNIQASRKDKGQFIGGAGGKAELNGYKSISSLPGGRLSIPA